MGTTQRRFKIPGMPSSKLQQWRRIISRDLPTSDEQRAEVVEWAAQSISSHDASATIHAGRLLVSMHAANGRLVDQVEQLAETLPGGLSRDQTEILMEVFRRHRVVRAEAELDPTDTDLRYAVENGPRFRAGEWFPRRRHPSQQRHLLRQIRALESAGLLICMSRWGRHLTHLRTTGLGWRLAESLLNETQGDAT